MSEPRSTPPETPTPGACRATVRFFGSLRSLRRERGLPTTVEIDVDPGGTSTLDVAVSLDLPLEQIEGVFVNHTVRSLGHPLHPGDRAAFVPVGTPGPHRLFLGLFHAGRSSADEGCDEENQKR